MDCITVLSDLGLHDASLAYVKGSLMQYCKGIPVLDMSHLAAPFHIQQAGYILASGYESFPPFTCHVILFDVFQKKESTLILCEKNNQLFLAPDNGILSLAFPDGVDNVWACETIDAKKGFKYWLSRTCIVLDQLQSKSPEEIGLKNCELKNAPLHWKPIKGTNTLECHVIHIDHFENVILNIRRTEFESWVGNRNFKISFMKGEEIHQISDHYTDVKEGEKLCRFNNAGYLEIAINRGKAASLFGLKLYKEKHIIYNTIKIFRE